MGYEEKPLRIVCGLLGSGHYTQAEAYSDRSHLLFDRFKNGGRMDGSAR
jgi:hypothetical protein